MQPGAGQGIISALFREAVIAIEPKRQVPRLKTTLGARLPDGWRGEVVDLSVTGMRIRTMAVIPLETSIEVGLEHEGRLVLVRGTIVWAEPPNFDLGVLGELGLSLGEVTEEFLGLVTELFANA